MPSRLKTTFPVPAYKLRAVAPVVLPMVIVFAFAPVPIFKVPVVPESIVRELAPVEEIVPVAGNAKVVEETVIESNEGKSVV